MIVFFDGVCGLCNSAVDFLLAHDQRGRLQFAPLQGSTARARLTDSDLLDLNSIIVVDESNGVPASQVSLYRKSTGVLRALIAIGGAWGFVARIALLVPRFIRDFVYDIVATNRYAWFGKRDTCRLPTPDERSRFLD